MINYSVTQLPNNHTMTLVLRFIRTNTKIIVISAIIIYHFVISGLFIHTFKILPYEFRWLTDAAILALFIYSFISRKGIKSFVVPKIFYLLAVYFAWCFITSVVNSINFITFLLQLKDYIRFSVLALAVINLSLTERDIKWLLFVILGIISLQIPVTTIQCALWTLGDWCVGTLSKGGTSEMVFLCCLAVSLVISLYVYNKEKLLLLVYVPFFSLPIIFGLAYAGLILYPYSILFTLFRNTKQNVRLVLFIFGVIVIFLTTLFCVSPLFRLASKRYVSLLGVATRDQLVQNPRINAPLRIKAPIVAWEWLSNEDMGWLFGYGFGITKKSHWPETTGKYAREYAPRNNQIATSLLETGLPGIFFVFSLFVWLFVWCNKMLRKLAHFSKAIALTSTCAVSLMIIGSIYSNILKSYYFGFLFWLIFAFLYTLDLDVTRAKRKQIGTL